MPEQQKQLEDRTEVVFMRLYRRATVLGPDGPIYGWALLPIGGVTVAAQYQGGTAVKVAFAYCSTLDNFVRRTGHNCAIGKLDSRTAVTLDVPGVAHAPSYGERLQTVLRHITAYWRTYTSRRWHKRTMALVGRDKPIRLLATHKPFIRDGESVVGVSF